MLSTKWPSMMSQWIQSAPASSTLRTSPARFEKSAARMDGATITFGIAANVQRSTLNVQCSIEVWSLWALGFRASAQPPLYIKSLTAGRAVSCYRVSAGKNPPARRTDCFEVTEAMLRHFISKVHNRRVRARPRVVIAVPSGITEVEKRAVRESATHAGAREVYLIEEPMAAAIGVGLPVQDPAGNMIIDIGVGRRFAHGPLFDFGDPGRNRNHHAWPRPHPTVVHFRNKMPQHRFGDFEVRDHAVFQRADCDDVRRRPPEHALRFIADREHFVGASLHGHHRRLAQDDPLIFDVNQGIGRAEIDPDVVR